MCSNPPPSHSPNVTEASLIFLERWNTGLGSGNGCYQVIVCVTSLLPIAFSVSKPSNLSGPSSLQSGARQTGGISLIGSAASNSNRGMRGDTVERDTRPGMGAHTQPPSQPNPGRDNQSFVGEHMKFLHTNVYNILT